MRKINIFPEDYEVALTGDILPLNPLAVLRPLEERRGILVGYDEFKSAVFLDLEQLPNSHGIITGTTGSGKSTLARTLAMRAREKYGLSVVFIDPHGEHEAFVEKSMGGAIVDAKLNVPDITREYSYEPKYWAEEVSGAIKSIAGLTETQRYMLTDALLAGIREGDVGKSLEILKSRATNILVGELCSKAERFLSVFSSSKLDIGSVIAEGAVDLTFRGGGKAVGEDVSTFLSWIFMAQVESFMKSKGIRDKPELLVIIDEAHRFFQLGKKNTIVRAFQETRKFGFGYIVVNQLPAQIPIELYQLAGYSFFLPGPVEYVRELEPVTLLTDEDRDYLLYGIKGTAIFIRQGDPRPRRIRLDVAREALI